MKKEEIKRRRKKHAKRHSSSKQNALSFTKGRN
jgi:hypothetical protein